MLRRFALELLRWQLAVFADLANGKIPGGDGLHPPNPPPPDKNVPEWYYCGHCTTMPTQEENKCCTRTARPCISITLHFQQLILDANILDIAMRYCEDIVLVLNNVQIWNNENVWHAASRQYVLWQHGHMIICCVVVCSLAFAEWFIHCMSIGLQDYKSCNLLIFLYNNGTFVTPIFYTLQY